MSGKIKGIVVEIGGDTTKLEKALKNVETDSKKLSSELKAVNQALKLDPGNSELLAQKQQILTESIEKTSEKLRTLKSVQEQVNEQFSSGKMSSEEYRAFQREISNAESSLKSLAKQKDNIKQLGNSFIDVTAETRKFQTQAKKADADLKAFGTQMNASVDKLAGGVKTAAASIAAAGTAIFALTASAGAAADDINTLSKQTGISTEELQKFSLAADLVDVSVETYSNSMAKLTKNMSTAAKGTGDAYSAFSALGIEIQNMDGTLRSNDDVFDETIAALSKMENETQRDAYAMAIFGKSAQDLNPLILGGVDALNDISKAAENAGIVLSQDALDGLNEFNDKIDMTKATAVGMSRVVATEFTGAFDSIFDAADNFFEMIQQAKEDGTLAEIAEDAAKATEGFVNVLTGAIKFIIEYRKQIVAGAAAFVAFKAAMEISKVVQAGITAYKSFKTAIDTAKAAQLGLNAAQAASPIGLIVSAAAALTVGIIALAAQTETATKKVKEMNKELESTKENSEKTISTTEAECAILVEKEKRYDELRKKAALTAGEQKELAAVAKELAEASGISIDKIKDETGAYIDLSSAIDNCISKKKIEAQFNARTSLYEEQYKQLLEIEQEFENARQEKINGGMSESEADRWMENDYTGFGDGKKFAKQKEELQAELDDYDAWLENYYHDIAEADKSAQSEYSDSSGYEAEYKQKYATEEAAAQKALEDKIALYEEEEKIIERAYKRQEISEEEYYRQKESALKKHGITETKDTQELYDEIYLGRLNLNSKLSAEATKTTTIEENAADKIVEAYQKAADEIVDKKEKFASKLNDMVELTSTDDGEMVINDIEQQTAEMERYVDAIIALKEKGASQGLLDKVLAMSEENATEYAQSLVNASGLQQYLDEYAEMESQKERLSAALYQTEVDDFQSDYVDKIQAALDEMADSSYDKGVATAEAFLAGLKSTGITLTASGMSLFGGKTENTVSQSTANGASSELLLAIAALSRQIESMKSGGQTTVIQLDGDVLATAVTERQSESEYKTGGV